MDREQLANKFQWHIEKSAELWVVRNFYDGRVSGKFQNYDEAFDRCNLLNAEQALKGLDEWESIDTAPEEKWVLCYRDGAIFFAIKTINGRVWMKKRKSRESLKALEKDPTHWKPITPPKDMGGAK